MTIPFCAAPPINKKFLMIYKLLKYRYVKFCFVGLTGLLINVIVLYLSKHYIFNRIQLNIYQIDVSLNLSMLTAIFFSSINNFILNSLWTWSDRYKLNLLSIKNTTHKFLIYLTSSSLGIGAQLIFSNILVLMGLHYLISVFCGVVAGSIFNFLFNHFVTFKAKDH
jgi:putative flippase GtrA